MALITFIGLGALHARAMSALDQAVAQAAEDLVGRAQQAAPVEEGTLRAGIHMTGPTRRGNSVEAVVQTGGETTDYAIIQHERTDFAHPRGGQAKYIEGPLLEMTPVYREHLNRAVRSVF